MGSAECQGQRAGAWGIEAGSGFWSLAPSVPGSCPKPSLFGVSFC